MSDNKKSTKKAANKKSVTKKSETKIDYSKLKRDVRLIPIDEFDWTRLVYGDVQTKNIPGATGTYKHVNVQYMYDDEHIGPAIVGLGKHYCFGVQADNTDNEGNVMLDDNGNPRPLKGYKVPIVMTSQKPDKPEPEEWEAEEVDFFDAWRQELTRYAIENKKEIGKGNKSDALLEDLISPILYRKGEKDGNIEEGISPKLYANLIYYANKKEVGTSFYGPGDREMKISELKNHFHIHANIRFDNITVTSKAVSLKVRLYDATVEPIVKAPKKRLASTNTMEASEGDFATPPAEDEGEEMMESEAEEEGEVEYEDGEEVEYEED